MKTKAFSIHDDANNIRCLLYSGDGETRRVVVYCNGFAGNKATRSAARFAEYMLPKYKDMAVLCFDWPCHGEDVRKKLSLADCDSYLRSVIKYANDALHADSVYCYATSFGAYLSLKYCAENGSPFRMIALRAPAVKMYGVMCSLLTDEDFAQLKKGKEVPVGFDRKIAVGPAFLEELKKSDITANDYSNIADTVLIMHGTDDEVAPFESSRLFAEQNKIDFIEFPKADHRFSNQKQMTEAIQYIEAFFC